MAFVEDLLDVFHADVCIELRRSHTHMTQQLLNDSNVGAMVEEVRGEGMPEELRCDIQSDPQSDTVHDAAYGYASQRLSTYRGVLRWTGESPADFAFRLFSCKTQ